MLRRRKAAVEDVAPAADRPDPPPNANHLVVITLDSLRYDSWLAASPKTIERLGDVEQRWTYASWTAPSHYNFLMGLMPHTNPRRVFASELYKTEYIRYTDRLGIDGIEFRNFLPAINLASFLRNTLGYTTHGMVSMPVLNERTPINQFFDSYRLMERHNDMAAMIDRLRFDDGRPTFHLLNVGETHYPYALPDEDPSEWPRVSGAHGVLKDLDDAVRGARVGEDDAFFSSEQMDTLRERQVRSVRYVDGLFERLYDIAPKNTWIIVTSDHGDLFGEDGFFGHGPVMHEKVFEVPFVEGRRP